jgi:hypothetical protein
MAALFSLLCIGIGSLLVLVGLLMIAPQVRVHRIKVYSVGSWLFRAGMILTLLRSVAALSGGDTPTQVIQVAQLMGVAGIMGGIITAGHEWRQAHDNNDTEWNWWKSLTLQMVVLGVIVLAVASVSAAR